MDWNRAWGRLLRRFWFLRGVAAALALAQLVPMLTDLSRWEFLRAFRALLVGWNKVASWIGMLIGNIPLIPDVDALVVNSILFGLSVGLPSAYYFWKSSWLLEAMIAHHPNNSRESLRRGFDYQWFRSIGAACILFLIPATYYQFANNAEWAGVDGSLRIMFGQPVLLATNGLILLVLILSFVFSVWKLAGYGKGLVIVCTFVAAMQLLYWLDMPYLADQIRQLSEGILLRGG